MKVCSVTKDMQITEGAVSDYRKLCRFHYRDKTLAPIDSIFIIGSGIGVIVYTMPSVGNQLRNIACGGMFDGLGRRTRMELINKYIRCIGRVIIEPRFRGLGLAARLIRETIFLVDVPIIEAMAVMGHINPFFIKAGMKEYTAPQADRCIQMIEALDLAGIAGNDLLDAKRVQQKLGELDSRIRRFVEGQMKIFLESYGKRRHMAAGLERTRFVLGKLSFRPVYYVLFKDGGKLSC